MGTGSNFIWSEGDGEGGEDNGHVSNQVGGLIIAGSGFIMSLLQLGNFLLSILGYLTALPDGILAVTVGCLSVLETQRQKPSVALPAFLPSSPALPISQLIPEGTLCFPVSSLSLPSNALICFYTACAGEKTESTCERRQRKSKLFHSCTLSF